jgi:hypothetical protein
MGVHYMGTDGTKSLMFVVTLFPLLLEMWGGGAMYATTATKLRFN